MLMGEKHTEFLRENGEQQEVHGAELYYTTLKATEMGEVITSREWCNKSRVGNAMRARDEDVMENGKTDPKTLEAVLKVRGQ